MRIRFWRNTDAPPSEAARAQKKAEQDLVRTRAETPKYRALGNALRDRIDENNLGRALTESFRGKS
jgi:hypothetical protein